MDVGGRLRQGALHVGMKPLCKSGTNQVAGRMEPLIAGARGICKHTCKTQTHKQTSSVDPERTNQRANKHKQANASNAIVGGYTN